MSKDDKSNGGSFLGRAASLGVGGAVGYNAFKKLKKTDIISPSLDPRSSLLNRIQNIKVDKARESSIKRYQTDWAVNRIGELEDRLNKRKDRLMEQLTSVRDSFDKTDPAYLAKRNAETIQIFQREWQAAVDATFPNPMQARSFTSSLDPLEGIRQTLRGNSSVLTQRAFNTFESNVRTLIQATDINSLVPFTEVPVSDFIKGMPESLTPREVGLAGIQNTRLRTTIGQIESALGRELSIFHRGAQGSGEFSFGFAGQDKPLFRIPEAFAHEAGTSAGLIRTGTGLHNVYAPGVFGILDETGGVGEELTYSELKAERIHQAILENNLTARSHGLRQTLREIEDEVGKLAPYMEPNVGGDLSFQTVFSSHQMTVLDKAGKPVTGEARRIVAEKLYNESRYTPIGTGSTFSLFPEEEIYGPLAKDLDFARKPWQRYKQYTPTESAMAAIKESPFASPEFDFLDSPEAIKRFNGPSGARLKTLYLSDEQINLLNKTFGITIGDGELLLHESVKQKLQVTRTRRINLNILNTNISKMFKDRNYNLAEQMSIPKLPVSGVLGRSATGEILTTKGPTSIIGFSPNITERLDKTKVASMDLLLEETINMTDVEKVFGGLKGEARFFTEDPAFGRAFGELGLDLTGIEAIARAGDLKDDAKLKQAMIGHHILQQKEETSFAASQNLVNEIKDKSIKETKEYFQSIANPLTGGSFDPKKGGTSITQLNFGGEAALTGAGNIGTLEPRVFTSLAASNPGGLGSELSNEFLERMVRWSPERVTMHEELMKTLGSVAGTVKPTGTVMSAADLGDRAKKDLLMAKGGFVETGVSQMPHIYVPGYETVPEMHPRMVGTGAVVPTSQPSKIINDILGDITAVNRTSPAPMTQADFISRFEEKKGYLSQLVQEAAIGGKGAGSIARGELAGSRGLTIVSEADPRNQAAFETMLRGSGASPAVQERIVGLPRNFGREMFDEMSRLYGNDVMEPMRKRFEAGERVAGVLMRHPTFGPYAAQAVMFQAVDHMGPQMLIPERSQMMTFTGPQGSITKDIHTGILTGMGADKDADVGVAMLASPQMEQKLRNQMESIATDEAYRDHSIRMQLLKPKATKEGATTLANIGQLRAAEATKLGITSEQVGILSSNLTKARVAVSASSLSPERKLRAMSLMDWMEQVPISGKHLQVSEALSGAFEQQMSALSQGAQGNAKLLEGAVTAMTENTIRPELKPMFEKGMQIQGGGFAKGFELTETSSDIANSIVAMRNLPAGAQLAAAAKYSSPSASGAVKIADLPTAIMANQISRTESMAVEGSRAALAAMNKQISSFTQAAKPYLKPLALAAVAGGLTAAILSPGPGTMATGGIPGEPPPRIPNPARDDISIPGITNQRLGSPTVEPHLRQQTVMAETHGAERRKSIRARIQANGVTPQQRQSLAERLSSRYPGSQINVRMQDDRKSLNVHSVNDMIE